MRYDDREFTPLYVTNRYAIRIIRYVSTAGYRPSTTAENKPPSVGDVIGLAVISCVIALNWSPQFFFLNLPRPGALKVGHDRAALQNRGVFPAAVCVVSSRATTREIINIETDEKVRALCGRCQMRTIATVWLRKRVDLFVERRAYFFSLSLHGRSSIEAKLTSSPKRPEIRCRGQERHNARENKAVSQAYALFLLRRFPAPVSWLVRQTLKSLGCCWCGACSYRREV